MLAEDTPTADAAALADDEAEYVDVANLDDLTKDELMRELAKHDVEIDDDLLEELLGSVAPADDQRSRKDSS